MDYVENCVRTIVTFCRLTCQHSSGGNHRRLPQKIAVDLDESQAGAVFYYRKNVFKNQLLSPGPITNSPLPFIPAGLGPYAVQPNEKSEKRSFFCVTF